MKRTFEFEVITSEGVNFTNLERWMCLFEGEIIKSSEFNSALFNRLRKIYVNRGDLMTECKIFVLRDIEDSELLEDLIESGVIEVNNPSNNVQSYTFIVKKEKEFELLIKGLLKYFFYYTLWLEKKQCIINYIAELNKEGVYKNEILSIQNRLSKEKNSFSLVDPTTNFKVTSVDEKKHENRFINNGKSKTKNKPPEAEPKYISFYSSKIKELRAKDINDALGKMYKLAKLGEKLGLLSDKTDDKLLLDFFTTKKLAQNRKILWKGTPFELKEFTKLIAKTGICDEIKPRNPENWEVVRRCFHIKLRGKPIGQIDNSNSISGAKPTKDDRLENVKLLVDKIKEVASD